MLLGQNIVCGENATFSRSARCVSPAPPRRRDVAGDDAKRGEPTCIGDASPTPETPSSRRMRTQALFCEGRSFRDQRAWKTSILSMFMASPAGIELVFRQKRSGPSC